MSTYLDEIKPLILYRKKFFIPVNERNRRKGSAIFLLTPNIESTNKLMNAPLMINNKMYESYYTEKDITYFINNENALVKKFEQFIHESVNMISESTIDKTFKNPKELSDWMKVNIKYKEYDKLMTAEEVYKEKRGSCHDQVVFEKYIFNKMKISARALFFIEYNDEQSQGGMTHTLLYYMEKDKLYWFENAWNGQEGIHGPYNNIKELKDYIVGLHKKMNSSKQFPKLEFFTMKNIKPGMSLRDYVTSCLESVNIIEESTTNKVDYKNALEVFNSLTNKEKYWLHIQNYDNSEYTQYMKVYKVDNKNAGFIDVRIWDKNTILPIIAIKKEYRSKGLSTKMIAEALKFFKNSKFKNFIWVADFDNKISNHLAKKFGFKLVEKDNKNKANVYELKLDKSLHESLDMGEWRKTPRYEKDLNDDEIFDGYDDNKYDATQLKMGIEIEFEHTKNPHIAKQIAKNHLDEIPDYYTRLNKMEKQAEKEGMKKESTIIQEDFHKKENLYREDTGKSMNGYNIKDDLIDLVDKMDLFTEEEAIVQLLSKYKSNGYNVSLLMKFRDENKNIIRWVRSKELIVDPQDYIDYKNKKVKLLEDEVIENIKKSIKGGLPKRFGRRILLEGVCVTEQQDIDDLKKIPYNKENIEKYLKDKVSKEDLKDSDGFLYVDYNDDGQYSGHITVKNKRIISVGCWNDHEELYTDLIRMAIYKFKVDSCEVKNINGKKRFIDIYKSFGFEICDKNETIYFMKIKKPIVNENAILEEVITDYQPVIMTRLNEYTMDDISIRTNTEDSNCMIFFNENVDVDVFNGTDSANNKTLRRFLYNERIRNNKEVILLYDKVKEDNPWIKKTYIDYKFYNQSNLFIDWSYYTQTFFKNNIYKLDKGVNLFFDYINRFLHDKRLETNGYTKKTVLIPITDWVPKDDTNTWDHTKNLNPISIIYRLMKLSPEKLKSAWSNGYEFVFISDYAYFKVDFSNFEFKDVPKFLNLIKAIINKEPVINNEPENVESTKAIITNIVDKLEQSKGITINNLTGGTDKVTPKELENRLNDGISSKDIPGEQEIKKSELVSVIKQQAEKDKNTEETIDELEKGDDSDFVKSLIKDLQNGEDDSIKINKARAARITELNNRFLNKEYKGRTIRDILETEPDEVLPETSLPIESINEGWKSLKYVNMHKHYDLDRDVFEIITHFGKTNKLTPVSIQDYSVEDTSNSEDFINTWTIKYEDVNGKRFTVKFDVPRLIDNRFMRLRGNEKTINGQLMLIPIIKTDEDTVQIVSNYNKIFIRRYGSTPGKSMITADRLMKTLNKYEGNDIIVTPGNNSMICSKYELPLDYIDLASEYNKIEYKGGCTFYFNQDELKEKLKDKEVDYKQGIPIGIENNGDILYANYSEVSKRITSRLSDNPDRTISPDYKNEFFKTYETTNAATKYAYSKASILNTEIPVIVIMGYNEGLQIALKKANIVYEIKDKRESYNKDYKDVIKFNDGYLYYHLNQHSSLLMNGLKECNTEDYSIKDINDKTMWIEFLDIFGGRIKADGLDNFYDCMIDPITEKICEKYELPTDYIEILAYSNMLLCDNKYNKHVDITGNRLRSNEIISGYTYKVLADAYGDYKNQLKRNRKDASMSIKQSAVIDSILLDPTASDLSILNPLLEMESANSISFKGLSGMNSDRSYSLDKRTFDKSMINVLGMSTGFGPNVGITRQSTIDANIEGVRGYIKQTTDMDKLSTTKTLTMTEALTPLGVTHDDPFRSAMTFIQTSKHTMRVKKSSPNLITNGADEALAYLTSDTFSFKSKQKGKVVEKTDDYMIIEYDDDTKTVKHGGEKRRDYIDLRELVKKNSDGGFYITIKLDTDLKVGSTFKQNKILAYDKLSYSKAIGSLDNKNISYNIGHLAKIAIMNTDEGFEDSTIISEYLSDAMTSDVVVEIEAVLPKNTNLYNIVKKGQAVQEGDPLLIFQNAFDEEDANLLIKNLSDDEDTISELGRIYKKAKNTGVIQDIKIFRTVEIEELSGSLKSLINSYEKDIKTKKALLKKNNLSHLENTLDPDYKLEPIGKLKGARDSVMIKFYLKYEDKMGVGDKLVDYSALKGVVKDVYVEGNEPCSEYRPNEKIHSLLALSSVNARMVGSIKLVGGLNKGLIELDRQVKEIMGIKWKNLDEM